MESAAEEAVTSRVVAMSFLLDSDTCSAYLKGHPKVGNQCVLHHGSLSLSAISVGELRTWTNRKNARVKTKQSFTLFLNDVEIIPVERTIAERFGIERARLFDLGTAIAEMDLFIAATALVHDLTLVTHNLSDYLRVPGLRLVDWLE